MNKAIDERDSAMREPGVYSDADFETPRCGRFLDGQLACFTHRSPDKDRNQDAVAVVPVTADSGVLVVADGLGGQPRGDLAARSVVDAIARVAPSSEGSLREAILHGIDQANKEIVDAGYYGGATVAVLEIDARFIRPYHVGDAFIIVSGQRGRIKYQNIPHSPVGYAVESGLIDENDAVHHHERNLVSNFVGTSEMYIDIGPRMELAPRDTVLIASDGLSDNLYVEEIIETIRAGSLDKAASLLQSTCLERMSNMEGKLPSHPDDLSFCLYRLDRGNAATRPGGGGV
ncbi:MAG TPA: protein phosphatase 2C domain-containing protein [Arenicellales bacterium]|nr:protein phosphatase 2C domain-containing protein [Arenicellales bacterium]